MKSTLLKTISVLAFTLTAAPAFAGEIAANIESRHNNIVQITPFNLVTRGYQGAFKDLGVPSNVLFIRGVHSGRITAEDLVEKAIASGRLAPETINDRAYLRNVTSLLRNLDND